MAPSAILTATPIRRSGTMAANTASAPVLIAARWPITPISLVQERPSPATSSGCAIIAPRSRTIADCRASAPSTAPANCASARAKPLTLAAKFGAEQPSMP